MVKRKRISISGRETFNPLQFYKCKGKSPWSARCVRAKPILVNDGHGLNGRYTAVVPWQGHEASTGERPK